MDAFIRAVRLALRGLRCPACGKILALVGLLLFAGCAARPDLAPRLSECAGDVKKLAASLDACARQVRDCYDEENDIDEDVVFCRRGELKL